jgi:hypothetical protein
MFCRTAFIRNHLVRVDHACAAVSRVFLLRASR